MALNDQDQSRAELQRRSLARKPTPTEACLDPEQLAAYYERSLDATEMQRFETHLSNCAACREQVAAMVRADGSEAAATSQTEAHGHAWLWNWRWLVPVAALLAISVFWFTRRAAPSKPIEPHPLVAMSQPSRAPALASPRSVNNSSSPLRLRTETNTMAKQRLAGADENASQRESKKATAQYERQVNTGPRNQVSASNSGAQALALPISPPTSTRTAPNPAASGGQVAGGIIGGNPSGVPGHQQVAPPATSELVSRYSTRANASLQGAYQRSVEIRSPDPHVLWRVSGGGNLERSTDGGITWQNQHPAADARLLTGVALSSRICWVAGRNGIILLTRDGANWSTVPPPTRADFIGISANDDSDAIVTTVDGHKFATQNAGKNWHPVQ